MQEQMKRGIERTEQMKAEKLRRKQNKLLNMKEGTKKTMLIGLQTKKKPFEVMMEEYERRKKLREKK